MVRGFNLLFDSGAGAGLYLSATEIEYSSSQRTSYQRAVPRAAYCTLYTWHRFVRLVCADSKERTVSRMVRARRLGHQE
jgi:hypothetical protein